VILPNLLILIYLKILIFFHKISFMNVVCNVTIYHIYFFQIFWRTTGEPLFSGETRFFSGEAPFFPATKNPDFQQLISVLLSKVMFLNFILHILVF